ncbi:epimerase [Xanthobacteraceae bacterium Astr-EGSB]|uniref:NAD-dependent epimerase/dehydratase family protein n=1 Tax=Astrobacterium formosum TaxID=3069710 RepID=UPI0027B0364E|nr:epimerase [Xanthobacteraceae bacterium Astr-EGSB]
MRVIITGSTGMVGEGVLLECLDSPDVGEVLVINRRPLGRQHAKLREIVHGDFFDLAPIEAELAGYDACFFCLGVSSIGMAEADYRRVTHDLTLGFARALARHNPGMTFCYVTGAGTDSSEKGRLAWARIKGATENALMAMFANAYMFRPGFMKPSPGQRNLKRLYAYLAWIYPLGRRLYPAGFCTLHEVGRAMINAARKGYSRHVLEVPDIVRLAEA